MRDIRKTLLVLGISAAVAIGIGAFAGAATAQNAGHSDMKSGMKSDETAGQVTLTGEVLDLYCFMKHPATGQGEGHAKCATSCINKGLPIGFLSDGVVYLIIGKDHESAKDMVADFAGTQSVLTGTLVEHDGIKE